MEGGQMLSETMKVRKRETGDLEAEGMRVER